MEAVGDVAHEDAAEDGGGVEKDEGQGGHET